MRALDYALREGWASLWRTRGSSILAIVAIALAMTVLGVLLLVTWNVQQLLAQWSAAAEFSVYLRDDATSEQRGGIEAIIDESGVAAGREYVSKADALGRFRQEFAELATLAAGFENNPFPASLEVRVVAAAQTDGRADTLVKRVAALPGVADVRYDREWLSRLTTGLETMRAAGLALVALMMIAAGVTVATVVRLGLHGRRAELEIMELVGSPMSFIRGPFIAEGLLQGGLGALLALAVLWAGYGVANAWWGSGIEAALDGGQLAFLPARLLIGLPVGGMVLGAAGGFAAARHAA